MIGTGHAHFPTRGLNRARNIWVIGGDDDASGARFACPFKDMHNHRFAIDIHQRFTWQAR
ncbi:Uncharacterised protein [Enterobacter cloacae]|nr:Uncharacterised protein [Enterobacter cloacae]